MLTEELFHKHLRTVLNHLYNRDILRESPLIAEFSLSTRADPALALQRIVSDAIEALKPPAGESLRSEKRRIFEILMYRYIEQFKQEEVAHNIDVSIRQFRREQDKAIAALMIYLWDKYQLEEPARTEAGDLNQGGAPATVREWDWLQKSPAEWVSNLPEAVAEAIHLIQPVAEQYRCELSYSMTGSIPDLAVHPIAFRQILLNLIRVAIDQAPGGRVRLEAHALLSKVTFSAQATPAPRLCAEHDAEPGVEVRPPDNNLLEVTAQIVAASSGALTISAADNVGTWQAVVTLPTVDGIPVLVVDDNKEIIDLLTRYSAGSRYRITGVLNPEQAIEQAISSGAEIVVMDVMMPHIDGWELLGRFRQHPHTARIPLIVLSILAQKELALSLGAKALMIKPIKQDTFLSTLDQVFSQHRSGWHERT